MMFDLDIDIILKKSFMMIAAFIGGISLFILWRPKALSDVSFLSAGIVVGGISVGGGLFLSGAITQYIGVSGSDVSIGVSYMLGIITVGTINLIAGFFRKREENNHDILDAINEIRGKSKGDK